MRRDEHRTALLTVRMRPSEVDAVHRYAIRRGASTSAVVRARLKPIVDEMVRREDRDASTRAA